MQKRIPISELASVNIDAVNKEDLVDVSGFIFDTTIPQDKRAARLLEAVKNPYCFRVGDMGVKLEFSDNAPALQSGRLLLFSYEHRAKLDRNKL